MFEDAKFNTLLRNALREECSLHKQPLLFKTIFFSKAYQGRSLIQPSSPEETKTPDHHFKFNRKALLKRRMCQYENFHTTSVLSLHKENVRKVLTNSEKIHFRDLHMSFHSRGVIDPGGETASAPQMFLNFQPPRNVSAKWCIYVQITSQFNVPNDKTQNF
jgi:hypothetical protein